jgi:hypothetical protein
MEEFKFFREAGYDIVYLEETWLNQNHCTDYKEGRGGGIYILIETSACVAVL